MTTYPYWAQMQPGTILCTSGILADLKFLALGAVVVAMLPLEHWNDGDQGLAHGHREDGQFSLDSNQWPDYVVRNFFFWRGTRELSLE